MNEQELNNQVEANDIAGELSVEALDRAAAGIFESVVNYACQVGNCVPG